jgi:dihydrosphingosine 1-phosphate phosphatase
VSVGPQSEIDVWEQIDYRDEKRRRRSNSIEGGFSIRDSPNPLGSIDERKLDNDKFLDDEDERLLRVEIPEPRVRYDVEVVTKLIVYTGSSVVLVC